MGNASAATNNARCRILTIAWLALVVVFEAPASLGQGVGAPEGQAVRAQANGDEVSLDLVARDKKDKPILDLKPEEIEVTDDGARITLTGLRLVSGKQGSGPGFGHLITLVFDRPVHVAGNTSEDDPYMTQSARTAAARMLKMFPADGFAFSVLNIESRLRLQQEFTEDRKATEQAAMAATEPEKISESSTVNQAEKELLTEALAGVDLSGKPVSAGDRALAKALYAALEKSVRIAQDQHLRPSLAGLLALAQSQQSMAGKKDIVYFTSMQDRQADSRARDAIRSIIGTANEAGVSIYVVELNSLDREGAKLSAQNGGGLLPAELQARGLTVVDQDLNNNAMQQLAEDTGGSYITGDRLRKSVDEMVEDMKTYYVASYLPPNHEFDGRFRSVAFRPVRTGIRLRSRAGYLALPPRTGAGETPQSFELPLLKILSGTNLPTDVSFHAAILPRADLAEENGNTLAIEVPLSGLDIHDDPNTGHYSAHISMVADVKDKTGAEVAHFAADVPRRGMLKDTRMAAFEAITLQRHFLAPPGEYVLVAAVLDGNSGKTGTQRIAFEIPAETPSPSLSSMVLVRRTEQFGANDDPSDALRHGDDKVIPDLSGQLAQGAKDVSVFFVARSSLQAGDAAVLKTQVFRDGKLLGSAPATRKASASEFASYLTSFSIDPPMDGRYEVRAILSQGGKTAEASTWFTMTGTQTAEVKGPGDDNDASPLESSPRPVGPLVISAPANPMKRPATGELNSILADARQNAMDYRASLPNFICERVTDRSVDEDGTGHWKHIDKFTELLTYFDHQEDLTMLEMDQGGHRTHEDKGNEEGMQSAGEFGAVVSGLFRPASQADFQWKETDVLADGTVQVFDYRVARENSTINLRSGSNEVTAVGFHGQVLIDSATRTVRRISQVVDKVPKGFPVRATSVSVDYDYVAINNHDYLLPVGAQIIVRKRRRETDMNEIEFRNFRRFGSTIRILNDVHEAKP